MLTNITTIPNYISFACLEYLNFFEKRYYSITVLNTHQYNMVME